MHMVVSLQDEYDWDNDFLIIGIPPLERYTVFDNYKDTRYARHVIDSGTWQHDIDALDCHTGLMNLKLENLKDWVVYEDRSWTETQTLRTLFLLTSWLDSRKANYLIVNLSKPLDANNQWGPTTFLLPYGMNHPRLIVFSDTYYSVNVGRHEPPDFDLYSWMGHHGAAGNRHFFETSVLPRLKELHC